MNKIKLCIAFKRVHSCNYLVLKSVYNFQYYTSSVYHINISLNSRNMSQKSITSFFNITPKGKAKKETKDELALFVDTNNEATPDDADLKIAKRSRCSSSNDNNEKSPKSSEKKKCKRRRIESSESEPDSTLVSNTGDDIRLDKSGELKTYGSPENKSSKSVKHDSEIKVKIEKKILSPKKSPKKDVKTNLSYFTIKVEQREAGSKNNDIKKEDIGNEEDGKDIPVAEVDYDPAKAKYRPVDDACWSRGRAVPYLALARTLEAIEATSARLKMVEILSNYFRSVIALTPEDLLASIYLCLNRVAPAHHGLELGIAETYLLRAVAQCTGYTLGQMRAAAKRCGDLGQMAEAARNAQRTMFATPPLMVRGVLAALRDIAAMKGHASMNMKLFKVRTLYVACRHSEARYLIRCLEGKLRVGLAEQSLLQALALALTAPDPPDTFKARADECALLLKSTYCECPDYELLVPALLRHGVRALPQHCRLTPGLPLKPMLAHPTRGVHEVFQRFDDEVFTCEWKYDGERAQIHVPGDGAPHYGRAAVYSRNQENTTRKYPDVVARLPLLLKPTVTSCVLDCEVVAYDPVAKQILPFQILSTRKRKDVSEENIKVQVCVFIFDLLYLNGEPLVRRELHERRALLRDHFNRVEGQWQLAEGADCGSEEELQRFLESAVRGSCEGLMVKALRGPRAHYDIARRSRNWLKLKKDYLDGVGDTIDAVVVGAYCGRGKRTGVYGGFLLACYDPAAEQYQSLCKIGTGFSDGDLKALSERLYDHVIDGPRNYYMYASSHEPDVWFEAACVLEVRCADLSLSPAHRAAAGLLDAEKGVSLRFPRFVRLRDDKAPEQATSARQVAELYLAQDQVKNAGRRAPDADDFY